MHGNKRLRSTLVAAVAILLLCSFGCAGGVAEKKTAPAIQTPPKAEQTKAAEPEEEVIEPVKQEPSKPPTEQGKPQEQPAPIGQLYSSANQAYQSQQYLKAYHLYQQLVKREKELSGGQRRTVHSRFDEVKEMLRKERSRAEERKEAAAILDQIVALAKENKLQEAHAKLKLLIGKGLDAQLTTQQNKQLERYRAQIALATEDFTLLTKREKVQLAEESFEKGMTAYHTNNYAEAELYLDRAAKLDVSLGWWDNWSLRSARKKVRSTLHRLMSQYARGERLYKLGRLEAAKKELTAVKESGINCGPEITKGLERYLPEIRAKLDAEAIEKAKKLEQQIARLAAERARLLESRQAELRTRKEIEAKLADADRSWQAQDFVKAKSLLTDVQDSLKKLDVKKHPDLLTITKNVENKLAVVDARIEQQKRTEEQKKAAQQKVQDLLSQADKLLPTSLLDAQKKVLKARSVARTGGVGLTAEQQELCQKVLAAFERAYGRQIRERRERYLALFGESDAYKDKGEYQHAREALRLIEEARPLDLAEDESERLEGNAALLDKRLAAQKRLLASVEKLENDADALLKEDKLGEAARKFWAAVEIVRNEGLPTEVLVRILQKYEETLARLVPKVVSERTARLKAEACQSLKSLQTLRPYLLAMYYVEKGSPDLAKPYLEQVAADEETFGKERVSQAQKELEGIEARIEKLKKAELFARREQLARLYERERQFEQRVKQADEKEMEQLLANIADANLELQALKIKQLLARGGYPAAVKLAEQAPVEQASRGVVEDIYEPVARQVEAWRKAGELLSQAEKALGEGKVAEAASALSKVDGLRVDLGPLTVSAPRIREILSVAQSAAKQVEAVRRQETGRLEMARTLLGQARQRQAAYSNYSKAREAYLAAAWEKAAAALGKLRSEPGGMYAFERAAVKRMFARANGLVEEKEKAIAAAQNILSKAKADFDASNYASASEKLQKVRGMAGLQWDKGLAGEVDTLAEKIAQVEKEADEVLQQALKAEQDQDTPKLAELVLRFKLHYKATNVGRSEAAQSLLARCGKLIADMDAAVAEARKVLERAREDFDAKRYSAAVQTLQKLRAMKGFQWDKKLPAEADALAAKIAQKEKEAQELYQMAVEAYKTENLAKLDELLGKLQRDYKETETYQRNM